MIDGQVFDIISLHAAFASGWTPIDMIDAVFARIRAADDPGIFLHLADRASLIAEAKALGPFDPASRCATTLRRSQAREFEPAG